MKCPKLKLLLGSLLLFLAACSEDGNSSVVFSIPLSRVCSERVIDSLNPPSEVAVLGNSLLMGNVTFGLSASDSTKDYFYQLDSAFRQRNPDCVSKRIMAKRIENSVSDSDVRLSISENITPNISPATDLVIIQLGDNIDTEDELRRMQNTVGAIYDSICTVASQAKVVWVGEWYSTEEKQKLLKEMAVLYGAQFIDISDLNTEKNQGRVGDVVTYADDRVQCVHYKKYSVSGDTVTITFEENDRLYTSSVAVVEYHDYADESRIDIVGRQGIVTEEFAATHPSDRGFKLVAERILTELGF